MGTRMSREVKVASLILTPSHIEKNVNSLHEVRWVYGANAILLEQSVIDVSCGQYRQYSIYLKKTKQKTYHYCIVALSGVGRRFSSDGV